MVSKLLREKIIFRWLSETLQGWKLVLKEQNQNELWRSHSPISWWSSGS